MANYTQDPTNYTPIPNLHYWVQLVTPLVYDDSLSLYELMAKVVYKLNEVINIVNPLGQGIDGKIQAELDKYKKEWEQELADFQENITNIINGNNEALNTRIDNLTTDLQNQLETAINTINQSFADFKTDVLDEIAQIKTQVLDLDNANREWTNSLFESLKADLTGNFPPVIDPTDGLTESIQTALNHMWDSWRENSLTAAEYDALELTADAYDAKELTATAYDRYGKILLTNTAVVYARGVPIRKSAINMTQLKTELNI